MPTTRTTLAVVTALALLAGACGTDPAVEVDVSSVSVPVPLEDRAPVTSAPEPVAEPTADPAPATEQRPSTPAASRPSPETSTEQRRATPPPPDLEVGDDGCVTDRSTGLVVTCHDPASGPDEAPPAEDGGPDQVDGP